MQSKNNISGQPAEFKNIQMVYHEMLFLLIPCKTEAIQANTTFQQLFEHMRSKDILFIAAH